MEIHTCLWNEVKAFDFGDADFACLREALPDATIHRHDAETDFLAKAAGADIVLTWDFPANWYPYCPKLHTVMTPAAGNDWVEPDPAGRVDLIHGAFHGALLSESLVSALLFMNHRMPALWHNFAERSWDRNLQARTRLLAEQTVIIIGMGSIGRICARQVRNLGARVIGVSRSAEPVADDIASINVDQLSQVLPEADHVVLLLPGSTDTDRFMNPARLRACKPGAYLYNFGRGNALHSQDLVDCWDHLGGAFLDVADEEPLPRDSQLWQLDNIMITPHSSCVYDDYRRLFLEEVIKRLKGD
ncbi:MAG: NAD(P)-dependent oxidoreductase [Gammaproteobacteria bacterium]